MCSPPRIFKRSPERTDNTSAASPQQPAIIEAMADTRSPENCGKHIGPYLDTIYEDTERRLSCESALARVLPIGIATWCESVNAPSPGKDIRQMHGEPLLHYAETEETLKAGAVKIAERTWMSSPERAILDVAFFSFSLRSAEYILKAALSVDLSAEEVIDLAEDIGQEDGLRRIAAVCSLADEQHRREWHRQMLDWAETSDGCTIPVAKGCAEADGWNEDGEKDETLNVIWNIPRKEIYESVYR